MIIEMMTIMSPVLVASMMPDDNVKLINICKHLAVSMIEKEYNLVITRDLKSDKAMKTAFDTLCLNATTSFSTAIESLEYFSVSGKITWETSVNFKLNLDLKEGYPEPSMSLH